MVAKDLALLKKDQDRSKKLVYINNFLAEIFATLSLSAFQSNSMVAASISAPAFSSPQWHESPNGQVFGTNCVLTCDGFRNTMHKDRDETLYSLGFWGIVEEKTGRLITHQERLNLLKLNKDPQFHCNALGAKFHVGNVTVELDSADVVTMVFNSQIYHQTTHPTNQSTQSGFGRNFTRCATSTQISKTVAVALRKIASFRGDLSEAEWRIVKGDYGKDYDHEVDQKKKSLS